MKNVLKNLMFVGLFTFSIGSMAQTNKSNAEKFENFKREMDLTDAQVLKIKAIKDKYAAEKQELKNRLNEIRLKELEEIDRLYTQEQKAKLKAILDRHKSQKK